MTNDINPDELWARTEAYARRHADTITDTDLSNTAYWVARVRQPTKSMQRVVALAYLAGYDQRQQEDSGPTLDRDAALIAFAAGHHSWSALSDGTKARYREKATAARIMVGGTYAG